MYIPSNTSTANDINTTMNSLYKSLYDSGDYNKPCESYYNLRKRNGAIEKLEIKLENLEIKKVIFNDPATIVFWTDNSKTVVKCGERDTYDPEKGLAMCIVKRYLGNKGNYYNELRKWLDIYEEEGIYAKKKDKFDIKKY